ncbi:MaoC family dehydratase [Chelatococcus asaccharovorans]|uniref:MaoC family dehydratase n=1 Tax=Chelatococcus asaccharovorans TaxID=28210 RepID=UPI00224C6594|nr:Nodulation protein N [Chelatococcus asaccharovorans]CAH1675186.1 Nodulation protein N [Chelatococcus asaccharovorans]
MTMDKDALTIDAYARLVGQEVGTSGWIAIDQPRIDSFADATLDRQYIHVDPARAKDSPFGGTIAHGFLSVSLLSRMLFDVLPKFRDVDLNVNYGMNRLRFLSPVKCGSRIRGRFVLTDVETRSAGQVLLTHEVTVEIEHGTRPALVAEWLILLTQGQRD